VNADRPLTWEAVTTFGDNRYRAEGVSAPYVVWQRETWMYTRPEHPLLGELDGTASTLATAKTACQDDHNDQLRLQAWQTFMLTHEPGG
jgi:hypothetical protein